MLWENIVPIEKQSDDKSDQLFPLPFSKWKVILSSASSDFPFSY